MCVLGIGGLSKGLSCFRGERCGRPIPQDVGSDRRLEATFRGLSSSGCGSDLRGIEQVMSTVS
jgi:hypothetical protein